MNTLHQGSLSATTIWLTGLSGAGKSTLAELLAVEFRAQSVPVEVLDGDVIRKNLSKGLGFSRQDRNTNIRRIGFVSNLLSRNGVNVIVAAISPYQSVRDEVRLSHDGRYVEVFVDCPIEVVIERDPKGLYKKALSGEIANFTGVSDPYEVPVNPHVVVRTDLSEPAACLAQIFEYLVAKGYLASKRVQSSEAVRTADGC